MKARADPDRPTFELIPRGPNVAPDAIHLLARNGGMLVGAIIDDCVCTWLAKTHGQLELMMWPRRYRARFDPLEVLDERAQVLARGGKILTVGGGFLPQADPGALGHKRVFVVSEVVSTTP